MAKKITGDDWDTWRDVVAHFDISRDLSASSMIGAQGLQGKSWPDLDMLPLGWLTDQGSNFGPHRACNLTIEEQKTQMTLWSIAKSPLMFGGDVRKLDDATYNLITNPTLLEINSYSSNNMEFLYITAASNNPHHSIGNNVKTKLAFGLTSCKEPKANTWSVVDKNSGKICWNQYSGEKPEKPFCLYNRKALLSSNEEIEHNQLYQGKLHLQTNDKAESCLGASSRQKLSSKDFSRAAGAGSNGVRSWIATGRRGEVYVAFFNLNPVKTTVSAKISDIAKALQNKTHLEEASCKSHEIWSGKDFGPTKDSITIQVESHGPALFILMSKPWGGIGIGAWADEAERADEEQAAAAADVESFPSLKEAASNAKSKKKKKMMTLSEFTSGRGSVGLTQQEILQLPTGPRQRSEDEMQQPGRLGGGFSSYGDLMVVGLMMRGGGIISLGFRIFRKLRGLMIGANPRFDHLHLGPVTVIQTVNLTVGQEERNVVVRFRSHENLKKGSSQTSRPSSAQSNRSESSGLSNLVNPFGDAKPREVLLGGRWIWNSNIAELTGPCSSGFFYCCSCPNIDFFSFFYRPRNRRREDEETEELRKKLDKETIAPEIRQSDQEPGSDNNHHETIRGKEKGLELLTRELDDKVRFRQNWFVFRKNTFPGWISIDELRSFESTERPRSPKKLPRRKQLKSVDSSATGNHAHTFKFNQKMVNQYYTNLGFYDRPSSREGWSSVWRRRASQENVTSVII
ncbi:LOW QUALITY PROTEIN: hypothetical protein HID58_092480 [Brassica napus]|uniref:alpha-galactosidase n=2 Tax=Brassica napus TaxID=3708 RepID=A0ABQ7WYK4_BRANA|nr:LOW QUALITY PROTEIN: hypothetical protein HID58_092480 [Brassica napus]